MTDSIEVTDDPPVLPSDEVRFLRSEIKRMQANHADLVQLHAQATEEAAHWLAEFKKLQAQLENGK